MSNKHDAPPQYPAQTHLDAGPYNPPPNQDYYGQNSNQAQSYYQQGPPQQGYYGQQPPQPGYGPPQQGMYYQQQGPPPQGYYADDRGRGSGAGGGLCAGLLGALACCCCLDFLF
ncbi:MAG: hypothetical protein L6R41_004433 [Letrouitia leprolyta]|nr:MAG: hypothetical protein L6R41_004433 [Letrouitia leprolyta]